MQFSFEKLGFVNQGKVELADLTLLCGPNNVGKTYITYIIYGIIKHFKDLSNFSISREQLDVLKDEGSLIIDLRQYKNSFNSYLKKASTEFSQRLDDYFNAGDDFFAQAKVSFTHDSIILSLEHEFNRKIRLGNQATLLFDKAKDELDLSIAIQVEGENRLPIRIIENIVNEVIADCLFLDILPKPFVVTSERTGIALFSKELDINRNAILDQLVENEEISPISLLNTFRARYAHPIHDNISIIRDYVNLSKQKSFIREDKNQYKSILDILQSLLGGSFKIVDQQVMYVPRKERNRDKVAIPVYMASSSVKSLFLLDLYVNCLANKKGLLVIDEPELNLHPDNQRKMASLLARLVNAGVKVLLTTHSDYLVREINNRIMLSGAVTGKTEIMKEAKLIKQDILNPAQVKAFNFKTDHSVAKVSVDQYGMNTEIFDNLIAETNTLSDEIYYNVQD